MKISCEVSLGELVDKLTILEIKSEKITNSEKLHNINNELNVLNSTLTSLKLADIENLKTELKKINLALWQIEDDIREKERDKKFDDEFIQLARDVYITNDKRFEVKNKINNKYGSNLKEEKSYEAY